MKATHNIKVNGKWILAGEEYEIKEKAKKAETAEAPGKTEEESEEESEDESKAEPETKEKTTPSRRKAK